MYRSRRAVRFSAPGAGFTAVSPELPHLRDTPIEKMECAIIRLTAGRGLSARMELARSDKSDMEGGNATPRITCRDNESPALRITRAARRSPCQSFPALRTSRAVPGGHPRSEPRSCRRPTAARSMLKGTKRNVESEDTSKNAVTVG